MTVNNKKTVLFLFLCFLYTEVHSQNFKNIIFMVPDGTSISVLSLARWYQFYEDSSQTRLAIDPHICGIVKNHSSNAPIGDSAPTMSWYMTGYPSQTKFTSMYPLQSENDLVRVDAALTYSPRMTVMEAARITLNKAIGLVFTCEFPHATPAATSSHWYNRNDYQTIIQQMIHNSIDVLIGGGAKLLTSQDSMTLVNNGYQVYKNEIKQFEKANNKKMWALFGNEGTSGYLANDWDRNPAKEPSLAQMTQKAIELLSTNKEKEGFFLMVEGSKIDWASHNNDPVGILSEILAFDAAVKVVIEFAQKNGETLVVICPDHGNGGVSIGNRRSNRGYDQLSLREILEPLKKSKEKKILQRKQYVGFTTTGHTGEDLFLAIYDPRPNKRLSGLVTPDIINRYLCDAMGVKLLDSLTNKYYCKSTELFNEERYFIQSSNQLLKITPRDRPNTTLTIVANSNMVVLNEEKFQTQTPAIYVDKNKTWYISEECFQLLQ